MSTEYLDVDIALKRNSAFQLSIQLKLPMSGITGIMGVSGSGKTTLLRVIAGLEEANGTIALANDTWLSSHHNIPTYRRSVGYVFQEPSLFPHLSVRQNLNYALKRAVAPTPLAEQDHLTELLGIQNLLSRMPHELSGGEKQRVAIARAIFRRPRLLLMDEPLAALDAQRKQEVLPYMERLTREIKIPILYVSHSIEEVARISDRIVYLEKGKVVSTGEPNNVLSELVSNASEIGSTGIVIAGKVIEHLPDWHLTNVSTGLGELLVPDLNATAETEIKLFIQANQVSISLARPVGSSALNCFEGRAVEVVLEEGSALATVTININGTYLIANITRLSIHKLSVVPGAKIWASIKSATLVH